MGTKKCCIAGICLCLCLGASVFAGLVDTEVGRMTDGQQLLAYFDGEHNGYRREAFLNELPATMARFKLSGNEQWVDQLLDKALDDAKAYVVIKAIFVIGDLHKKEYITRLIALYQNVATTNIALSQTTIQCVIVRTVKQFSDPQISAFLNSILQAPPQGNLLSPVVRETITAMAENGDKGYIKPLQDFTQTVQSKISSIDMDLNGPMFQANAADKQKADSNKTKYHYWKSRFTELASTCSAVTKKLSDKQGGVK
jgi:hypothetical protein